MVLFLFIHSFIHLFIHRIHSYLQTWAGETIQCAALFSHGTQVAMFTRKCSAGNYISKTGMGRDPKMKKKRKKKNMA